MRSGEVLAMLVLAACAAPGTQARVADAPPADAPPATCPASPPADGAPCTRDQSLGGLACEYGGTAHTTCTTAAFCSFGNQPGTTQPFWTVQPPAPMCETRAAACPARYGDTEGAACSVSLDCEYDEGVCGCEPCGGPVVGSGYWHCRPWTDVPAGCPVPRPHLGDACSVDGLRCDYTACCGGPSLGARMTCQAGYWSAYVDTACFCAFPACP
jgi:hypothetical protein